MGDDNGDFQREKPFYADHAKTGRAACKKCKQKIDKDDLRLGKLAYNPFGSGTMKLWHHVPCMFEVFKKQRKTTKKIDTSDDIGGWDDLCDKDKETIKSHFTTEELLIFDSPPTASAATSAAPHCKTNDNSFRIFRKICSELTNASSYLNKTAIVKDFFKKGSSGNGFAGDIQLWCRSLLPMAAKRVYNLQSKQLVKIFSEIFGESHDEMLEDLEQGDVAQTIGLFFEKSSKRPPAQKAVLTLTEVDDFLEYLSKLTRETDQKSHFEAILPKCTANDLKMIIRLIKHDLRINAGPKHILEALHPDAYQAFQNSRDLAAVVKNASGSSGIPLQDTEKMTIGIKLMTPVRPMLAEACKSVEYAFKKCPKGMYSEIKYDGERVQLHKEGDTFKYFSRSLKPVVPHKVNHFSKHIPQAFPHGKDLILDAEVLMMDTNTGQPLPFGTLGVHKRAEFQDATVCLFVFDCLYLNGTSLVNEPITKRRKILLENMTEIPNHVMFSNMKEVQKKEDLEEMMEQVFKQGLEGLVLKALDSVYEPGKRHWLKVKKDYLFGGSMADTADLLVLGAWYGTGKKGGIMSVFLMGCYDEIKKCWVTVTKVHGGLDDNKLNSLQSELKMVKISQNVSKVPSWLHCNKTMVPDFVAENPKESQVWEITGAEFTCNQVHTANGISIRFPRITKIRSDKDWKTATSLAELKVLHDNSKDTSDFSLQKAKNAAGPGKDSPKKLKNVTSPQMKNNPSPEKVKNKGNNGGSSKEEPLRKASKREATSPKKTIEEVASKKPKRRSSETDEDDYQMETDEDEESSPQMDKGKTKASPSPKKKNKSDDSFKSQEDGGSDTEVDEDPVGAESEKIEMENALADIFSDVVVLLHQNIQEIDKVRRYVIAYGGRLYSDNANTSLENSKKAVTHVVYQEKQVKKKINVRNGVDQLKHVSVQWLWESIKKNKLQQASKYIVTVA